MGKIVLEYSLDRLLAPNNQRQLAENIHLTVRGSGKICIIGKMEQGRRPFCKTSARSFFRVRISGWVICLKIMGTD